jgi:hypothetical protein
MKTVIQRRLYFQPIINRIMIGLILGSAISVSTSSPAFADRDNGHGRFNQGGERHQEWRGGYGNNYGYGRGYRPIYRQPVYVPPPVYFPPSQSPGINLFLPFNLHH